MEQTILTEEQLIEVTKKLEETRTEPILEDIDYDNSNAPLEEGLAQYVADGILMEDSLDYNNTEFDINNLTKDLDKYMEDSIKDNVSKSFNDLDPDETIKFVNAITRFRKGENFNIYNELPEAIKTEIQNMINLKSDIKLDKYTPVQRKMLLELTAKELVKQVIDDSELDSMCLNLEDAIRTMIPTPNEIYSENNREYIEVKFLEVADNLKEKDPIVSQKLLNMREGYIHAYTFESMYDCFKESKTIKNVRRSEVTWNRTRAEYLKVAGVCQFSGLYPLDEILNAMKDIGFTNTQAYRLTTLFVYTYTKGIEDYKDPTEYNDIYRNAFATYFEMNIRTLALSPNLTSNFSKEIKNNLITLCNHIDEVISQKEAELSNKKKKRG